MSTLPEVERIREDFPVLQRRIHGKPPIYLDNACTTLRPEPVIRAVADHQRHHPSCHGRAYHRFGREATDLLNDARDAIRTFIGASGPDEIVFVRNATEGLNLVARSLPMEPGSAVLTTNMEHNSNLLPWQQLARDRDVRHEILHVDVEKGLDLEQLRQRLEGGVRLVSLFHVSNFTGLENPVAEVCREAHTRDVLVLVDGAQSVLTRDVDVRALGADFFVFSLHKMHGPTGIGVLYGRREELSRLRPFLLGGETVEDATYTDSILEGLPQRFEAGVANVDGAIGARAAVEYVTAIGRSRIHDHVVALNRMASDGILCHHRIRILGPREPELRGSVLNFHVDGVDSRSLARVLDESENVMVRYGKHCAHAWYNGEGVPDSVRVSFAAYNTEDEVETLVRTISNVLGMVG